jgi:uncharacterized protein (UPF0548 family)
MILASKPSRILIDAFIAAQQNQKFSYPEMGASREGAPRGYTVDHNRVQLGVGAGAYEKAKRAIRQWKMFDMPWINLCWPDTPIEPGATVAVVASHLGFCSMNAARIVYVLDDPATPQKSGFAYGTLPDHSEIGEERFTVELNPTTRRSGTTSTPSRARGNSPASATPSPACCRGVLPETRSSRCAGSLMVPDNDRHQKISRRILQPLLPSSRLITARPAIHREILRRNS